MKKPFILLSAVSLCVLSACNGNTNPHMPPPPPPGAHQAWNGDHMEHMRMITQYYFNQMDVNDDGKVTLKEFLNFQRKKFHEIDADNNGYITVDDLISQEMREKHKMKEWKSHMGQSSVDGGMQRDDMRPDSDMNNEPNPDMNQGNH